MNSKDITLWIDERWYDALNRHLKDETLEEHLEKLLRIKRLTRLYIFFEFVRSHSFSYLIFITKLMIMQK